MTIRRISRVFFENAYKRKKSLNMINSLERQINKHLFKVILFSKSSSLNHWIDELNNFFYDIFYNYGNIKKDAIIKDQEYLDILYYEPLTPNKAINDLILFLFKQYNKDKYAVDIDLLSKKLFNFYKDIIKIRFEYSKDKLIDLLNKYFL